MKNFVLAVCAVMMLFASACSKQNDANAISPDKIYFFYSDGCPHCHDAQSYISATYPNLKMERVNVATAEGYNLFVKCANKFNLGNMIGTPLFCMGDKHLMGWSPAYEKTFDGYVQPFLNK